MFNNMLLAISDLIVDGAIYYPGFDPKEAEQLAAKGIGGPFELVCSILMVGMFVFILATFFIKKETIRIAASFLCALDAIAALILYPINQMSIGAELTTAILGMLLIGVIFGVVSGIVRILNEKKMRALEAQALAAAATAPDKRPGGRRFDD